MPLLIGCETISSRSSNSGFKGSLVANVDDMKECDEPESSKTCAGKEHKIMVPATTRSLLRGFPGTMAKAVPFPLLAAFPWPKMPADLLMGVVLAPVATFGHSFL